jgi:radical SAM superfamily enzyme
MYEVKLKFKGSCPKHTHYNPERDGRSAIRGGCLMCEHLAFMFYYVTQFEREAHSFQQLREERKRQRAPGTPPRIPHRRIDGPQGRSQEREDL